METIIPSDLRYSKDHEWVRFENGIATIGITDYAQDQLGDIVYLDLPGLGSTVIQFDKFGEVESVKAVSELYCPISGEVVEANQSAADEPEVVNSDPYGDGWLIRVRVDDPSELDKLLTPEAYRNLITAESEDEKDA